MTTPLQLDHFVIAVKDLGAAIRDYEKLGFTVSPGGRHTHAPTHNALVYFQDGAYLELIEWLQPAAGEKWYERLLDRGEGVIDFALCTVDLATVVAKAEQYGKPVPGSRVQADGQEIRWQLGWPVQDVLPFLCGDLTPRLLRVPDGPCRRHENGVTGVLDVSIRVADLDAAVRAYGALLQSEPVDGGNAKGALTPPGLQVAVFAVGSSRLNLVASVPGSDDPVARALSRDVKRYGPGLYRMTLSGPQQSEGQLLDLRKTHGVTIQINENPASPYSGLLPANV